MRKNSVFLGLILGVASLLYSSCEDTTTVGFPVGNQKIQTIFLDTFTVKTSTILLDSIATAGTGRILVGEYHDATFGKTVASSYFQLGTQDISSWTPDPSAVFDSMSLILRYDKYFYGDTTQVQNLVVNELSENITARTIPLLETYSYFLSGASSNLFNKSVTKSYPTILGSINYKPRPISDSLISIRLNDPRGKDWLEIAKGENSSQLLYDNFLEFFKGVKVSTSSPVNAAVIGFVSSAATMRIYYSEPNIDGVLIQKYFDFKMYNTDLQYNQVNTDRTGTPLENLVPGQAISSSSTNNETFIQGGAGVLTKIEFPNFKYLNTNNQKFMVLSARLVVIPVTPPLNGQKKLPSDLGLLVVNQANIPTHALSMDFDETSIQNSKLNHLDGNLLSPGEDREFNRTTQYSFSLIQHIDALVNQPNTSRSVVLSMPFTPFSNSVTQLRIGNGINQDSKIKLEIYLSRLK